jgi:hypothetical protein
MAQIDLLEEDLQGVTADCDRAPTSGTAPTLLTLSVRSAVRAVEISRIVSVNPLDKAVCFH